MPPALTAIRKFLFPDLATPSSKEAVCGRAAFWLFLLWYFWPFFTVNLLNFMEGTPGFVHRVDLIFHEAGHIIFGIFGWKLLTAFGGTLMQCLVPVILMVAFWYKNRDAFAAGVFLTWTGQNFVDCAPYINDARLLQLPLITGGTGREVEGHDWEFMLNELGWIEYDGHIARWVLLIGRIIMALGFLYAAAAIYFQFRQSKDHKDDGGWSQEDDQKLMGHMGRR